MFNTCMDSQKIESVTKQQLIAKKFQQMVWSGGLTSWLLQNSIMYSFKGERPNFESPEILTRFEE